MNKLLKKIIIIVISLFVFSALFGEDSIDQKEAKFESSLLEDNEIKKIEVKKEVEKEVNLNIENGKEREKKVSICNGITITKNCEVNGVKYLKYKYFPPSKEVSHIENETTYNKEIVGYCTLCNDGTRSPSCSTGRGTCSHHKGVKQFNAPIYRNVAHSKKIKIIDHPAIPERYEKIKQ